METHGLSYDSPWYLRSGHLQTIFGALRKAPTIPSPEAIRIAIAPAGQMLAYPSPRALDRSNNTGILLIHGLGGCHASPYLVRIANRLDGLNRRVFRVDLPGSGAGWDLTHLPSHAGCSEQVIQALTHLSKAYGIHAWQIAGFSLGGNVAAKTAVEWSRNSETSFSIKQLVLVSPALDLTSCVRHIERRQNWIYNRYFVRGLERQVRRKAEIWPQWRERLCSVREQRLPVRTIRQFDEAYTSRVAGFVDADDYYQRCSTHRYISKLAMPIEILFDRHDPIVPANQFSQIEWHQSTTLAETRFGGHLGYVSKRSHSYWMDDWVVERLTS